MGGYGIVGGNLPIAAGIALASDYRGTRRGDAVHVRRRRLQPGHVRRDAEPRRAVAAAGRVHGHQQPVRHGHRARAPLGGHRPAAQGREPRRAGHALRRDGRARHPRRRRRGASSACARSAGRCWSRPSPTASAATRWPTPSSTAPRRRSRRWRERDPIAAFGERLVAEGVLERGRARADRRGGDGARRRGRRVRRRLAVPRARVAVRRRLRARRPGSRGWYSVETTEERAARRARPQPDASRRPTTRSPSSSRARSPPARRAASERPARRRAAGG